MKTLDMEVGEKVYYALIIAWHPCQTLPVTQTFPKVRDTLARSSMAY